MPRPKGKWVKPVHLNQWGYEHTFLGEVPKNNRSDWTSRMPKIPEITESGKYKIKWPNGKTETVEFIVQPHYTTVTDMGHSYDVSTKRVHVKFKQNGAVIELPLFRAVGLKVWVPDAS